MSGTVIKTGRLPEGETLLWRGQPTWRGMALRAFHLQTVLLYFGALLLWHAIDAWWSHATLLSSVRSGALLFIPLAAVSLLLGGLAWLTSKTTHYTITNRRILLRIGIALPMTLTIPFRNIGAAGLKAYADGTGDIPLSLTAGERVAYILLWPHARPWRFARAEPMLRAIPDARHVAEVLAQALTSATQDTVTRSAEPARNGQPQPDAVAA